jgi:hypothetical protein
VGLIPRLLLSRLQFQGGTRESALERDAARLRRGQIVAGTANCAGGVRFVEGSLAVILVAYGASRIPALSVVLDYWLLTL